MISSSLFRRSASQIPNVPTSETGRHIAFDVHLQCNLRTWWFDASNQRSFQNLNKKRHTKKTPQVMIHPFGMLWTKIWKLVSDRGENFVRCLVHLGQTNDRPCDLDRTVNGQEHTKRSMSQCIMYINVSCVGHSAKLLNESRWGMRLTRYLKRKSNDNPLFQPNKTWWSTSTHALEILCGH